MFLLVLCIGSFLSSWFCTYSLPASETQQSIPGIPDIYPSKYLESRILQENNIRNTYLDTASIFPIARFSRAFLVQIVATVPASGQCLTLTHLSKTKYCGYSKATTTGFIGDYHDSWPIIGIRNPILNKTSMRGWQVDFFNADQLEMFDDG